MQSGSKSCRHTSLDCAFKQAELHKQNSHEPEKEFLNRKTKNEIQWPPAKFVQKLKGQSECLPTESETYIHSISDLDNG